MRKSKRLWDTYRFLGFWPEHKVVGVFGDPYALVIRLRRRGKKRSAAPAVVPIGCFTTGRCGGCETLPVAIGASIWTWRFGGYSAEAAER